MYSPNNTVEKPKYRGSSFSWPLKVHAHHFPRSLVAVIQCPDGSIILMLKADRHIHTQVWKLDTVWQWNDCIITTEWVPLRYLPTIFSEPNCSRSAQIPQGNEGAIVKPIEWFQFTFSDSLKWNENVSHRAIPQRCLNGGTAANPYLNNLMDLALNFAKWRRSVEEAYWLWWWPYISCSTNYTIGIFNLVQKYLQY